MILGVRIRVRTEGVAVDHDVGPGATPGVHVVRETRSGVILAFVTASSPAPATQLLEELARRHPSVSLLVLHGSRARGDSHAGSDWDFAYLAEPEMDVSALYADLALTLGTDHVDLLNLSTAGGLIRYRVARDGCVIAEALPGTFDSFWFESLRPDAE